MRINNLIKILFVLFVSSLVSRPSSLYAAFEDTGTGARGTALGDNFVSMSDDATSLMYNPAELARVQQKELASEYSRLYAGLTDGSNLAQYYMGYAQPISYGGTVSFGWKEFSLDQLYQERTLSLGYGEWLTESIAIGGAVKQLYHAFGVPNTIVDNNGNAQAGKPTFFAQNGNSNTAYSADLGMLYHYSARSSLGISIQDINEPNVALNPADHEIVPRTIRISDSYEADRHLTVGFGVAREQNLTSQTDTIWSGSAEKWWALAAGDQIALRGSLATGSREFQQGAIGAGYKLSQFQIDYAFIFNLVGVTPGNTAGTHRFSLTYRFGPKGIPAKKAQPKVMKHRKLPEGYEQSVHETEPDTKTYRGLPRALDLIIIPEEIDVTSESAKAADVSIDLIFDSDYDGVADDRDLCPDTQPGMQVDAHGCSSSQVDHQGNPLPHKVHLDITLEDQGFLNSLERPSPASLRELESGHLSHQ